MSPAGGGAAGERVLLLGGSSEIGLAIVRELQARAPRQVALLARDETKLEAAAAGLRAAGCPRVLISRLDANDTARHGELLDAAIAELGGADIVVLAVGMLGEPGGMPRDVQAAVGVLQTNTVGVGSLALHAAERLRARGGGSMVVLSSVAAERPRPANFVYGASKVGADALARGLGDALYDERVRVLVVRPGFVRTSMTQGMQAAPFAVDPEAVARAAVGGLERGTQVVWVPAVLRWLMLVIRLLPRQLFRRLKQ